MKAKELLKSLGIENEELEAAIKRYANHVAVDVRSTCAEVAKREADFMNVHGWFNKGQINDISIEQFIK